MAQNAELFGDDRSYGPVAVTIATGSRPGEVSGQISGSGLDHPEFALADRFFLRMGARDRKITIRNLQGSPAYFVSGASDWG